MLTVPVFKNYLSYAIFYHSHLINVFLFICICTLYYTYSLYYTYIYNQFFYLQRNTINIQYSSYNSIYVIVFRKENFSFKCIVKLKNKSD